VRRDDFSRRNLSASNADDSLMVTRRNGIPRSPIPNRSQGDSKCIADRRNAANPIYDLCDRRIIACGTPQIWRFDRKHGRLKPEPLSRNPPALKAPMKPTFRKAIAFPCAHQIQGIPMRSPQFSDAGLDIFGKADLDTRSDDRNDITGTEKVDGHQRASAGITKKSFGWRITGGSSLAAALMTSGILADGTRAWLTHSQTVLWRVPSIRARGVWPPKWETMRSMGLE